MAKSARKLIQELGKLEVDVKQVAFRSGADLVALSFTHEDVRYDDMFNVTDPEVKNILEMEPAGKDVRAVIIADSSEDADEHCSVQSATIVGND